MNAVILAAGKGSRLGKITETIPKPLIEYKGRPIIFYHINICIKYNISQIFINTHHLSEMIKNTVMREYQDKINIEFSYESDLLGTAGALNNFRKHLSQNDFVVIYGDNIVDYNIAKIYEFHRRKDSIATIVGHFKKDVSMSGVIIKDKDDRIVDFVEKPKSKNIGSNLVNAGIYMLSPNVFKYIPLGESDFGKDIFPNLLSKNKKLFVYETKKELLTVDTPELYYNTKNEGYK